MVNFGTGKNPTKLNRGEKARKKTWGKGRKNSSPVTVANLFSRLPKKRVARDAHYSRQSTHKHAAGQTSRQTQKYGILPSFVSVVSPLLFFLFSLQRREKKRKVKEGAREEGGREEKSSAFGEQVLLLSQMARVAWNDLDGLAQRLEQLMKAQAPQRVLLALGGV